MLSRDYCDMIGGALLVVTGLMFSWYTSVHYNLGTLRHIGPGMFPTALGILLAGLGLMLVVPAFLKRGELPAIRIWVPFFVLAGVAAFALTIRPFGLLPSILAVTVISSFAESKVQPVSLAGLCAVLCLITWLIFHVGLGLPIPMFRWPF